MLQSAQQAQALQLREAYTTLKDEQLVQSLITEFDETIESMFAENQSVVQLKDDDLILEFVSTEPISFTAPEATEVIQTEVVDGPVEHPVLKNSIKLHPGALSVDGYTTNKVEESKLNLAQIQNKYLGTIDDDEMIVTNTENTTASDEPVKFFSEATRVTEKRGLTHWAMYTDGTSIFAWNLVLNTSVKALITDLSKASSLVVDASRGYFFVVEQIQTQTDEEIKPQDSSVVNRYEFWLEMPLENEDGGILEPQLHVIARSKTLVYEGQTISAITVDEDQSILYIADQSAQRIATVNYSPEKLLQNSIGIKKDIYENVSTLDKVSSLAVNLYGKIFWSVSQNGTTDGAIMSAQADAPSDDKIKKESSLFDQVTYLYYKKELLFFVAPSQQAVPSATLTNTAIYFKAVPKTGEHSNQINFVTDQFQDIVSLATLDNYIYVADGEEGFYAIESKEDGSYSSPITLPLHIASTDSSYTFSTQEDLPRPVAMVIFAMGGIRNFVVSVGIVAGAALALIY